MAIKWAVERWRLYLLGRQGNQLRFNLRQDKIADVKYRLRRCGREGQPTRFSITARLFSLSFSLSRRAPPLVPASLKTTA